MRDARHLQSGWSLVGMDLLGGCVRSGLVGLANDYELFGLASYCALWGRTDHLAFLRRDELDDSYRAVQGVSQCTLPSLSSHRGLGREVH